MIGILDEHPEWSKRLIAELESRGHEVEKIDHVDHAYHPRDQRRRWDVIVNRTSPSSHRRGHGRVLFYTEALLAHFEAIGVPVINPVSAWRFEKSKALQAGLFERLGVRYPRTVVANGVDALLQAARDVRFPALVKPNVGGSGALIDRFDTPEALQARAARLDFGPDGVVLLQEYVEPLDGAVVRVEVLDGRMLYAIRIVKRADQFNLCPADLCEVPAPSAAAAGACPVEHAPGLEVSRHEPPREAVEQAVALTVVAGIDVGGVEYLVGAHDGSIYFYDVNATSNFVAEAPRVLGFDPFPAFADYIERVAGRTRVAA
jgi:glutathione synthase/RimK-type ligase-like ATP-grasp enzyme